MAKTGRLPGHCTICQHAECARLELLIAGGAHIKPLARKFSVSDSALRRHWLNHVSPERRAALVMGPTQRAALAARVAEESSSVLDHHRAVRAALYQQLNVGLDSADSVAVALLAGRLTEVNNAIARLTGQLATSPLIQNTTIHNSVTLLESPEYRRLRDGLLQIARAHPDIRPELIALLRRMDGAPEPINAPIEQPAQPAALIEHEEPTDA